MAIIKCPGCGKGISERAAACIFCGRSIATPSKGVLRVRFKVLKHMGNMSITATFEGKSVRLRKGSYHDFYVPSDGKSRICSISCSHGLLDGKTFEIGLKSGESKNVTVTYSDGRNGKNKWECIESAP